MDNESPLVTQRSPGLMMGPTREQRYGTYPFFGTHEESGDVRVLHSAGDSLAWSANPITCLNPVLNIRS